MHLKLYGNMHSVNTQRVVIVLKEKKIPYEFISVDMMKGEHKSPEYTTKQPFGLLPAVVFEDGFTMYESRAICKYLARLGKPSAFSKYVLMKENNTLLPPENDGKAWAQLEQAFSSEIYNFDVLGFQIAFEKMFKPMFGGKTDEELLANLVNQLEGKMDVLEQILARQRYASGDRLQLVDLYYLPLGSMLAQMGYDFMSSAKRPHIQSWWKTISARPSWQQTMAEAQG